MIKTSVFDSNILIYYLNGSLNHSVRRQVEDMIKLGSFISVITRIEVLGWSKNTATSLSSAKDLLNCINEQALSEEIVKLCIQLRQNYSLKLPDAMIAATALHLELPLMTRNVKDFQKVSNLEIINPFE